MGCWKVMSRRLPDLLPEGVELDYIGRPARASPGEGYSVAHDREQERIVLTALTPGARPQRAVLSWGEGGAPSSTPPRR